MYPVLQAGGTERVCIPIDKLLQALIYKQRLQRDVIGARDQAARAYNDVISEFRICIDLL